MRTREVAGTTAETYVVTNNRYREQAVTNAVMLEAMLTGRPAAAPSGVVAAYAEALGPYTTADSR